jgi:hypothetical protein
MRYNIVRSLVRGVEYEVNEYLYLIYLHVFMIYVTVLSVCRILGSHSSACYKFNDFFLLGQFWTLKIEAKCFLETSVDSERITWRFIPEDRTTTLRIVRIKIELV